MPTVSADMQKMWIDEYSKASDNFTKKLYKDIMIKMEVGDWRTYAGSMGVNVDVVRDPLEAAVSKEVAWLRGQ